MVCLKRGTYNCVQGVQFAEKPLIRTTSGLFLAFLFLTDITFNSTIVWNLASGKTNLIYHFCLPVLKCLHKIFDHNFLFNSLNQIDAWYTYLPLLSYHYPLLPLNHPNFHGYIDVLKALKWFHNRIFPMFYLNKRPIIEAEQTRVLDNMLSLISFSLSLGVGVTLESVKNGRNKKT